MLSNHLILCHPLLLLPPLFPSIKVFSNELALHVSDQYWSFSFSISPSNEYSGLISFRMDWFDVLAVQGTLKDFSRTTNWRHQLFGAQPSLWSNSHIRIWSLRMCVCMLSRFSHVQLFAALWTIRSPLGSSVHGILQAWILGWVAMPYSRVSSGHWDQTCIYFSCIGKRILYH